MRGKHKLLLVVLVVAILATILVIPVGCSSGKKAIIIIPGIMGSNIVDASTGDPLWAPIEKGLKKWEMSTSDIPKLLKRQEVKDLLDVDGPKGAFNWLEKFKVNADGSTNATCEAQYIQDDGTPKFDRVSTYGTIDYYEKIYKYLKETFGDEYDVRLFEYDWRLDNLVSAERLEKFINGHKYKEVVLVAHSMGGVMASTYIAHSEKNAKKVSKFISLGSPFLGAHKALRVLDDPLSLLGDQASLLNLAESIINNNNPDYEGNAFQDLLDKFLDFVHDLPTIYQLLPYVDMVGAYDGSNPDLDGHGVITVDGTPIKKYDDFEAFLNGRNYINERCMNKMIAWQKEQYRDGKHATDLVDTAFFVGNESNTDIGVNFVSDGNGGFKMTTPVVSNQGDGTVAAYSASCGNPLSDPRIVELKGISHGDMAYVDASLNKIAEIIKNLK